MQRYYNLIFVIFLSVILLLQLHLALYIVIGVVMVSVCAFSRKTDHGKLYALLTLSYFTFGLITFLHQRALPEMIDDNHQNLSIEGRIEAIEIKNRSRRYLIQIHKASLEHLTGKRILFKLKDASINKTTLKQNNHISFKGHVFPYGERVTPTSYDFKRQAQFRGVSGLGMIEKLKAITPHVHGESIRATLTDYLYNNLPLAVRGVGIALITGDKGLISKKLRQQYADSGIAHILAVSGLHVCLVAGVIFLILRCLCAMISWVAVAYNTKKIAAVISVPFVCYYVYLTNFGYPAVRALIMCLIGLLAIYMDRFVFSLRSVCLAGTFVLLINPFAIYTLSFQLSFVAVFALVGFYEKFYTPIQTMITSEKIIYRFLKYPIGVVLSSVIATIATTPFIIYAFNKFTLVGVIGNIIAIPLVSALIMPTAVIVLFTLPIAPFFPYPLAIFSFGIQLMNQWAYFVSTLPGAQIPIPQIDPLCLIGFVLCLIALLFLRQLFSPKPAIAIGCILMIYGLKTKQPFLYEYANGLYVFHDGNGIWHNASRRSDRFYIDTIRDEVQPQYIYKINHQIQHPHFQLNLSSATQALTIIGNPPIKRIQSNVFYYYD